MGLRAVRSSFFLNAAKIEGPDWYAAASRWPVRRGCAERRSQSAALARGRRSDREDDHGGTTAGTCYGKTAKGHRRAARGATIPMTAPLNKALRRLKGSQNSRGLSWSATSMAARNLMARRTRRFSSAAELRLPEKRWHTLRHTFGTHAALFGVNPWRLQVLDGPQADRRDDDLRPRGERAPPTDPARRARRPPGAEVDPDRRIVMMLGSRGTSVAPRTEQLENAL